MEAIENTIKEWIRCWNRRDVAALASLWDEWEPAPVYIAEEEPIPLLDLAAIRDYWARTLSKVGFISLEARHVRHGLLSAELATALYDLRWLGSFPGYEQPIGGDTRVSVILRLRASGWRFVHYVEAPLAPIVYVRRLYEQFAARPPALPPPPGPVP